MSVLIKGMEMPKSCVECPCCRHDNWNGATAHQCNVSLITFGAEDEKWLYNTRPNWCPLVKIPPHGRLIAANLLKAEFTGNFRYAYETALVKAIIDSSPTVIEAEDK